MIVVRDLVKDLGATRALDRVSFDAAPGEVTALLGPNGAGKSTTMRVLATLLRPDAGTVSVDGIDVTAEPIEVRRRIGLVTEEPGLFDRLTVAEQLRFAAAAYGLDRAAIERRLEEVARALALTEELDRRAGVLSKGNRQKTALARAILHDPPVLLLDEPTSGLDVIATAGFEDLLRREEVTGGKTVLLSTHRLDEAERHATTFVGLVEGRVVATGTPRELTEQAGAADFREAFIRLLGEAALGTAET